MRKPISPRAGTRYSIRTQPVPWLVMCSMRPLRDREQLGDRADVLLGDVDRQALDGLVAFGFDVALEHVRLADGQLEALAAHHLDQHRQLQLAAALDLVGVGPVGGLDAQGDVADQLLIQARLDLARRDLVARLCPPAARC